MNDFDVTQNGTQATIRLGEKLVSGNVSDITDEMKRLLVEGATNLVVDCDRLVIIDSSGIGCFVAAYNSLSKIDGQLSIVKVSGDIYDLLCSMRLERRIHIEKSPDTSE